MAVHFTAVVRRLGEVDAGGGGGSGPGGVQGPLILEMSCERLIKEETFSSTNDFATVAVQKYLFP